jgi:hypothetical protein
VAMVVTAPTQTAMAVALAVATAVTVAVAVATGQEAPVVLTTRPTETANRWIATRWSSWRR